jgi:YVTN family beta-propeller protein
VKRCIPRLIAAFAVSCLLGNAQSFAQNAYITNANSNNVSVINTATNTVIATIPVGSGPLGVAVTPDRSKVYVANSDNTVSVINTATNSVTIAIPVPSPNPFHPGGLTGVAVTPDSSKVYVVNFGEGFQIGAPGTVSVIDTATNTVTTTMPIDRGAAGTAGSYGVAVTPDGSKVYIANNSADTVSVIDTATFTVSATIPIACCPFGVAVSPDSTKVYVTSDDEAGDVSVIDTAMNTVTGRIQVGGVAPIGIAVSPNGSRLYVATLLSNSVSVIDTATNTKIATIPVGQLQQHDRFPYGIALTSNGSKVYVANSCSTIGGVCFDATDSVSVIDTATNTVTDTIQVGMNPLAFGIFIQPAPKFAGTPGKTNCYGQSISALAQFGGLTGAASVLGFSSVAALQSAILAFCGE